jgi:adenylate kinase family enzyme
MKRVLVMGSGGAGKSTFARRLGERPGSDEEVEKFLAEV